MRTIVHVSVVTLTAIVVVLFVGLGWAGERADMVGPDPKGIRCGTSKEV